MFTIAQAGIWALIIIMLGMSVVLCLSMLYLFVSLINRYVKRTVEVDGQKDKIPIHKKLSKKKKEDGCVEDDIPAPATLKVETSFEHKRIGKV